MQVSFIIPLFNCLPLSRACLNSLRRSLPGDLTYEIILVDTGSTDDTGAWLSQLAAPIRVPRGRDIMAACGQLKSASERARRLRTAAEAAAG